MGISERQRFNTRGVFDNFRTFVACLLVSLLIHFGLQLGAFPDARNVLTLVGSDDAMRLMSIRDLLDGQGWFDKFQYRVIPPDGISLHWSRLLDAVMASIVQLFTSIVGRAGAEIWLTLLWPGLLFVIYLAAVAGFCLGSFSYSAASFGVLTAATLPMVNAAYFPFGRLDHHSIQVVFLVAAVALLAQPVGRLANGFAIGAITALSISVGLEMVVPFLLLGSILAFEFVMVRPAGHKRLLGFATGILLAAPLLFILDTPPSHLTAIECDRFSLPYLSGTLLASIGIVIAISLRNRCRSAPSRLALILVLAGLSGAIAFPYLQACSGGPFSGVSADLKSEVLDVVLENRSAFDLYRVSPELAASILVPHFLITVGVFWLLVVNKDKDVRALVILSVFLLLGLVGVAYQYRALSWGAALQPAALGVILASLVRKFKWIGMLASVILFVFVFSPAPFLRPLLQVEKNNSETNQTMADRDCQSVAVLSALNVLPQGLIMNPLNLGAFIIVHTEHDVLSAPYHRSADAMFNGMRPFSGNGAEAFALAMEMRPDYVVLCNSGHLGDVGSFRSRLLDGDIPAWLEEENLGSNSILVFRTKL